MDWCIRLRTNYVYRSQCRWKPLGRALQGRNIGEVMTWGRESDHVRLCRSCWRPSVLVWVRWLIVGMSYRSIVTRSEFCFHWSSLAILWKKEQPVGAVTVDWIQWLIPFFYKKSLYILACWHLISRDTLLGWLPLLFPHGSHPSTYPAGTMSLALLDGLCTDILYEKLWSVRLSTNTWFSSQSWE